MSNNSAYVICYYKQLLISFSYLILSRVLRKDIFAGSNGDRLLIPNFAIIVTDGLPNVDKANLSTEAIAAKISGIHNILVTVGQGLNSGRNYQLLQVIPSAPVADNFFNVNSFNDLITLVPDVSAAMCNGEW